MPRRTNHFGFQRNDCGLQVNTSVRFCDFAGNLGLDDIQFSQSLLGGDPGSQPADGGKVEFADKFPLAFLRPVERLEKVNFPSKAGELAQLWRGKKKSRGESPNRERGSPSKNIPSPDPPVGGGGDP